MHPTEELLEKTKTGNLCASLADYIRGLNFPKIPTPTTVVRVSPYSPFGEGGDILLYGTRSVVFLDGDTGVEGSENREPTASVEQSPFSIPTSQLKANMIATSIASWSGANGLPNINKPIETLVCYGVVVGVGCPIVLLKSIMDLEDCSLHFHQVGHYYRSELNYLALDLVISYIINELRH